MGGGILMVPAALYLIPGTTFHDAKAASLVAICGSGLVGVWTHHRHRSVDWRKGGYLAAGGLGGAALSALVVEGVDDTLLAALFGALLAATGARLALGKQPAPRAMPRGQEALFLLALGLLAGLLAGALGVGGGIVMVPGLVLAGVGMHLAVGTSLLAVLGNAVGSTAAHVALGYGPTLLAVGIPLGLGAIPGTHLGSRLAHRLHADRLRAAFGILLTLVGVAMIVDSLV